MGDGGDDRAGGAGGGRGGEVFEAVHGDVDFSGEEGVFEGGCEDADGGRAEFGEAGCAVFISRGHHRVLFPCDVGAGGAEGAVTSAPMALARWLPREPTRIVRADTLSNPGYVW
ncbi:hypothetical protein GCM10023405_00810 [Streptomonospora salina]